MPSDKQAIGIPLPVKLAFNLPMIWRQFLEGLIFSPGGNHRLPVGFPHAVFHFIFCQDKNQVCLISGTVAPDNATPRFNILY